MKKYFDFTLTGKVLFPLWMLYWLFFLMPNYSVLVYRNYLLNDHPVSHFKLITVLVTIAIMALSVVFHYYFNRIYINYSGFGGHSFRFTGKLGSFLEMILPNIFLTIITLSFYFPWLIKAYANYFVEHTEYKDHKSFFLGSGKGIFGIYMLVLVPTIIASIFLVVFKSNYTGDIPTYNWVNLVEYIFMIPAAYLFIKWLLNFKYKEYHIYLASKFWPSLWKIMVQLFYSMITIGIYIPVMYVKLYEYFVAQIVVEKSDSTFKLGFEEDVMDDFLFLWAQTLLSLVTIGIYTPWAISKIGNRFFRRTFIVIEEPEQVILS
ncbi:MAG: DUF898 family protein [Bacteroidales bacterium]|nr:DUF898 family protein [Bacteroidales bacterium]